MRLITPAITTFLMIFATSAYAYIGPGLGAGAIAVILGILLSIIMALLGIVWYPLKRIFGTKDRSKAKSSNKYTDSSKKNSEQEDKEPNE